MFNFNWIIHNSYFLHVRLPHNIFHILIYNNLMCKSNYKCKNQLLSANRRIKKALQMTLIITLLICRDSSISIIIEIKHNNYNNL